jgi:hypothetical protein
MKPAPEMIRDCVTFTQEADTSAPGGDGYQNMIVREEDGGGGSFYLIETERWAFDSIDEIIAILRRAGCRETSEPSTMPAPTGQRITVEDV